jgi:glycine dehydrogenase
MSFADRHIGPTAADQAAMLDALGYPSLDALIDAVVPAGIREHAPLALPAAASEPEVIAELSALAKRNRVRTSMIGLGYSDTITPPVIKRNVLESPSWYTAYTPYQPEISQGRLEALLNFQTMVQDLTGLPISNASLLDEATAAAEAVSLLRRVGPEGVVLVDADCLPQTIAIVRVRVEATGGTVVVADLDEPFPDLPITGVLVQYPGASGRVRDLAPIVDAAHSVGAGAAVAADLLSLALLVPPGEVGADVVVGSTQRFGVPLGFGGPHAGYMAVRDGLQRDLPGRLVGVSVDADGQPAMRLALQTREQHIRRDRATSNICTAQVLLAVMASMYAVYHGPDGVRAIAEHAHAMASQLAASLEAGGVTVVHDAFFDTVLAEVPGRAASIVDAARDHNIDLRLVDGDHVAIACDECTTDVHVAAVVESFGASVVPGASSRIPAGLARTTPYLTHPVFHQHRSETAMLRYLKRLADRDYALDRGMIPLGSCTMKLNATTEMEPVTWPELSRVHPFAPVEDTTGYREMIDQLERWLAEITGYDRVSVQPNAGSQGEFAGLLAIRGWHLANGETDRDVCLIPTSAHGTNPASATMCGMRVVPVACDGDGNVDLTDLRAKVAEHGDRLAALMVTYPSTHGVFEESIGEMCAIVHDGGGQVYLDGANLNALVGLARPGRFGADVSHLNLHKTFCIPHGGGGPGVGPVAVREHLAPYLPNHPLRADAGPATGQPISAAPWGSASILPISWAYVRLMGPDGLRQATEVAILSANYVARRLAAHYPVLYSGRHGLVAHECIIDLRPITKNTGITVDDVAKRLMDYGFHAPTMSFPVAGTLMIEPTESESLDELDRFVDTLISIRGEIERVASGEWSIDDNPLRNAPHTAASVVSDEWKHAYTREEAAYPLRSLRQDKYWPPVRRIDGAFGDRNLVCSCPSVEAYA